MSVTQHPTSESRFVVLLHQPGLRLERTGQPHFDWMFQWQGGLRTWSTSCIDLWNDSGSIELACEVLPEHRLDYLDYEGEVSGGRGTVTRQAAGVYRLIANRDDLFHVAIQWRHDGKVRQADVEIYRSFFSGDAGRLDESRESWRLRFSLGR